PISVSGIGNGVIDFTIRRVGKVTNQVFSHDVGDQLFLRGPYGNGFDLEKYKGKELVIIAGGTGLSPVKGVVDYFCNYTEQTKGLTLIAGFKTPRDILFLDDFKRWQEKINIILTVDCAEGDTACHIGLVTQYIPQIEVNDREQAVAIVVGPPVMMKFATEGLLNIGFAAENIWISQER
ncbi:MAG: anaerobic sulfite reductase subunit AsrB, partial [Sporomusa sp.]